MDFLTIVLFSLTVVILATATIVLTLYYSRLYGRFHHIQKQNLFMRFHMQEKSLQKINEAKDTSLRIITEATNQAQNILHQTELLKNDTSEQTKQTLETLTKQQTEALTKASVALIQSFEDAMKHLQSEDINMVKNISQSLEVVVDKEVKSFEEQLHQETIGKEQEVDQKVQAAFDKAQQEIVEYKKNKISAIDQEVHTVVQHIAKEVIGKQLSYEDQRQLIMAALERAKTEISVST